MSATNHSTSDICVKIYPAIGNSKIVMVPESITVMHVYISKQCIDAANQDFRTILREFILILKDYTILSLELTSTIPPYIIQLFVILCRQLRQKIPIDNIVDENGQVILVPSRIKRREFHDLLRQPYDLYIDGSFESLPEKFIENRAGASREIYFVQSIDFMPKAMQNNENYSRRLDDNIFQLSRYIHDKIQSKTTKPPNFNNKTPKGYQKIKNYLHHITNIWFNRAEINEFINLLETLQSEIPQDLV